MASKAQKILQILKIYGICEVLKNAKMKKKSAKPVKRIWSKKWLLRRQERLLGACSFVHTELVLEDHNAYSNYLRMTKETFNKLYEMVKEDITKVDTNMRMAIPARDKLTVTLRFLATGESFQSLSYSTRLSISAISKFVPEVLNVLYNSLKVQYLKVPSIPEQWQEVANGYFKKWNVPNTIGSMDGKHITFRAPRSAGSHYYNYKGTHSIILLGIADANYKFIYIDVGCNGRVSDGGVYENCSFNVALTLDSLNLPPAKSLPGIDKPVPYVILADAAFPLQQHILKPYPFKNLTNERRIFNYRLSRGRRVIENTFGILTNRFRIFLSPINLNRDKVIQITLACCALHNYLRTEQEVEHEEIVNEGISIDSKLTSVQYHRGRPTIETMEIRNTFQEYFNGCGAVPWQNNINL